MTLGSQALGPPWVGRGLLALEVGGVVPKRGFLKSCCQWQNKLSKNNGK